MRESCDRTSCEFSPEYCEDAPCLPIPSGINFELTISDYIKVENCVEQPNYPKHYEIPLEVADHPCTKYYSTLSTLIISGYGFSRNDENEKVRLEVHYPNILQKQIPKYMSIYAPGTILFVKGRYLLPSLPEKPVLIFDAQIIPMTRNAIDYLEASFEQKTGIEAFFEDSEILID